MGCSLVLSITSPLARYYSDASSFPDYGDKKGDMAKGNVKGLGSSIGPRNDLNRTTGFSTTTTEHPSKRQKIDSSYPSTVRLTSSLPASKGQLNSQSSHEIWEIDSNSTTDAKGGKQSNFASQNEYRMSQRFSNPSKSVKSNRIRRGRLNRRSVGASSRESMVVDQDEDELAKDSPVKIVSDVAFPRGPSKRQRHSSVSEPNVKRHKTTTSRPEAIDNSADELSLGGNEESRASPTKGGVTISSKASKEKPTQNRGDIKPTQFRSEKENGKQHEAPKMKQEKPLTIARAVCADWSLESTPTKRYSYVSCFDSEGKWTGLQPRLESVDKEGNTYEDITGNESSMRAMGIDLRKVKKVVHLMTHSKCLIIERMLCPGRPPQVHIEMSNVAECSRLVGLFPPSQCQQFTGKSLEQTFTHKWDETAERQQKNAGRATRQAKNPLSGQSTDRVQRNLVVAIPSHREPRSTTKLKDQMKGGTEDKEEARVVSDLTGPPAPSTPSTKPAVPSGRRTRQSATKNEAEASTFSPYFAPEPSITRWTVENPDWESRWPKSLVYPATGRSRAVVDVGDIPRLDDGECLNDNIINFYLRWLKTGLQREKPEVLEKVHVFESYFFERLKTSKYQGVRSWTAKIDLLSYDYIVVPVNENFHWYLAIICNVAKALPKATPSEDEAEKSSSNVGETQIDDSNPKVKIIQERVKAISIDDGAQKSPSAVKDNVDDPFAVPSTPPTRSASIIPRPQAKKTAAVSQKIDPTAPRIITLDSLGNPHPATCKILREYLAQEAKDKKSIELEGAVPGMTAKGIPFQGNGYDCGTYTLAFIDNFLKDPDEVARQLLQKEKLDWDVDSGVMRKDIRNLLFDLQQEQQERLEQELAEKKARRRGKSVSGAVSSPAPAATPSASQEAHRAAAFEEIASSPSGGRPGNDTVDVSKVESKDENTPTAPQTPKASLRPSASSHLQKETPRLVSPLANSDDNTGDVRSDAFFSVRGSPAPKANGVAKHPSASTKSSPKNKRPQPSFIEEIPSSDEEPEEVVHKENPNKAHRPEPQSGKEPIRHSIEEEDGEKPIQPSVELDDARPRPKSSDGLPNEAGNEKIIQPSVEQDEEKPRPTTNGGVFAKLRNTMTGGFWRSPKKKEQQEGKSASYEGIDRS